MNQFKGDVAEMLIHMEGIYDMILLEGASHQDFCEDLLKALNTVQHEQFKWSVLKLQCEYDEGNLEIPSAIINKATIKLNILVSRKGLLSTDSFKWLSFMTSKTTTSGAKKGTIIIEECRNKEIPHRPAVESNVKVLHWLPKNM